MSTPLLYHAWHYRYSPIQGKWKYQTPLYRIQLLARRPRRRAITPQARNTPCPPPKHRSAEARRDPTTKACCHTTAASLIPRPGGRRGLEQPAKNPVNPQDSGSGGAISGAVSPDSGPAATPSDPPGRARRRRVVGPAAGHGRTGTPPGRPARSRPGGDRGDGQSGETPGISVQQ